MFCLYVCKCVMYVQSTKSLEGVFLIARAKVGDRCEQPRGFWERNPGFYNSNKQSMIHLLAHYIDILD